MLKARPLQLHSFINQGVAGNVCFAPNEIALKRFKRKSIHMEMPLKPSKAATGVPGLDEILSGGFTKGALFLVEGTPGRAKRHSHYDF